MALGITQYGIVFRHDGGGVTICRPGRNGGTGTQILVSEELANEYNLATGDVVFGEMESIGAEPVRHASNEVREDYLAWDEQRDEPSMVGGHGVAGWIASRNFPTERLASIEKVNGLSAEEALDRPSPQRRRHASERVDPDQRVALATGPADATGRMLDFAAPFGLGYAGIIYGPHATGLTRTLRTVVAGVTKNAPDVLVVLLLLRARGEELTDWRRRFPDADVVVCPSPHDGASPEQTLQIADLTLEACLRQTELGHSVLLAVDSLTGLWGAMLEAEEADAQKEADQSRARQRLREWIQKAGNFHGEGLLGGGLGGALTLVGTLWQQEIDEEAEEDRDIHPHLRLLEHILHETSWRAPLSGMLAEGRLYPAIDTARCLSQREEKFLDRAEYESLLTARGTLARMPTLARYHALMDAFDRTANLEETIQVITAG